MSAEIRPLPGDDPVSSRETEAAGGFHIDCERDGDGRLVLRPVGDLDLLTAPVLAEALARSEPEETLVVDLARVTFLDSSGLRALLLAHEDGAVLRSPSSPARTTFQVARVSSVLVDP